MADPETVQSRPPLETTTLRQGRGVPLGALVCDQVERVTASASVDVERDLYVVDTTSGSVTMTLPALASVPLGKAFTFYKPVSANSMVVDGYSSETIEGAANETRTSQYSVVTVRKVQTGASTYAWMLVKADLTAGAIADNSITNAAMADDAIDSAEIADGAVDPVHLAAVSVAPAANAAAAILNTTTELLLTVTDATNTAISTTSSVAGQRVLIRATAVSGGGSYTLAVTGGTLTINATGETAVIQRNVANDAWFAVSLTAGAAGGSAATIV